jgi:hypothetical protein
MKKETKVRFQIKDSKNVALSTYFKTVEVPSKKADQKKIIITPKNSDLVPSYVSYVLYPNSGELFSGKYLRARCS